MTADHCRLLFLFACVIAFHSCTKGYNGVRSPIDALTTFELAEGFQIELIAAEPLISDPVAMEIDEYGNLYVVEMHGYPLDQSGSGTVKLLRDTDGDGVMDQAKVFADNLQFPTGVMRWKEGILVTDPPNLLYFEDLNGDGQADKRDTLLTGFAVSNPQHNFNNPFYGLDNWIYLSNEPATTAKVFREEFSDLGAEVSFKGGNGPVLPKNAGGRRVRLKPDMHQLEALSSASQFGHTSDPWGRHILVSNANHIFHEVIAAPYLGRNPDLTIANATVAISDHGPAAEVYPITQNPEHQLLTDLGVFTAACGITAYTGGAFPQPFDQAVFVADPVGNLIHLDLLKQAGATFSASRYYENKEFLASTDPWFRPVNHYIGPDGALYIVDYYRRVIEHPEWMAEGAEQQSNLYDGLDQGRIYRVSTKGSPQAFWTDGLDLGLASNEQLLDFLEHDNLWYRRNAQRLLLDRGPMEVIPLLKDKLRSSSKAFGRLHAAWVLEGMEELDTADISLLLRDPEAGVRENAIRLAESFLNHEEIIETLVSLKSDTNDRVRFQLLCTIGDLDHPTASQLIEEMLFEHFRDPWMQISALSAKNLDYTRLLQSAITAIEAKDPAKVNLVQRLSSMIASRGNLHELRQWLAQALAPEVQMAEWPAAVLKGFGQRSSAWKLEDQVLQKEINLLLEAVFSPNNPALSLAALDLLKHVGVPTGPNAQKSVQQAELLIGQAQDAAQRIVAVRFLALAQPETAKEQLLRLIHPGEPVEVQRAVVESLGAMEGVDLVDFLIHRWSTLSPALREQAIGVFMSSEQRMELLASALENGAVDPSAVNWPRQVGLMAQGNEMLRRRFRAIFADPTAKTDKRDIIQAYSQDLKSEGDAVKGEVVFQNHCSVCHQIGGMYGGAYGPDLASIRHRKPEALLVDILDPNLSIADGFDLWEITLTNGERKQGIVGEETTAAVMLRIYGGEDEVISRHDIQSLRSLGTSMMPRGLENLISPEEMCDLLTFIKKLN